MKHQDPNVQSLIAACPEIEARLDLDEGPNYIFGQIGFLLRDRELDPMTEATVYRFLNGLGDADFAAQDLLVVNVLEVLCDTPTSVAEARKNFTGQALSLFERVLRGWAELPPKV